MRKELVRPDKPQLPGEDAFRFRHLLIRDAAYDALPEGDAGGAARALRRAGSRRTAPISSSWTRSSATTSSRRTATGRELGLPAPELADQARARLGRAGRRALERADGGAVRLLERAVALIPVGAYDANLELELVDALFYGGRPAESEFRAASLAERAAVAGDRIVALRAGLREAEAHAYSDATVGVDVLAQLIETARPELEQADDPMALYDLWSTAAMVAHGLMDNAAKLAASEQAIAYARRAGDERRARRLIPLLGSALLFGAMPVPEALSRLDEIEAEGIVHPALTSFRAHFLAMLGRFDEARECQAVVLEQARERGLAAFVAIAVGIAGDIEWLAGDVQTAARYASESCDLFEKMGHLAWLSTAVGELAHYVFALGRTDEADRLARRSEELGAEDDVATQVIWRRVRALVLAQRGDLAQAEALAREAAGLTSGTDDIGTQGATLIDLAEVLAAAGKDAEAAEALEHAVLLFQQKGNLAMAGRAQERLAALRSVSP